MVKISGSHKLQAGQGMVWPRVVDPQSLVGLIPGCQELQEVGDDEYRGQIVLGLPAVSGTFETSVRILEQRAPDYCRIQGEIAGAPGIVSGTASFSLEELQDGTLLSYEAEGLVSGGLGRMPSRFVESVAKALLKQGLSKLDKELAVASSSEPAGG